MKLPGSIGRFIVRLRMAYCVLFEKKHHWILINLKHEDFIKILKDESFDLEYSYFALRPYLIAKIFHQLGAQQDETDLILLKAEFEAEVDEFNKDKKT